MSQQRRCRACKGHDPAASRRWTPTQVLHDLRSAGDRSSSERGLEGGQPRAGRGLQRRQEEGCGVPEPSLTTVAKRKESEHVWS